jgi:hypothetical protein
LLLKKYFWFENCLNFKMLNFWKYLNENAHNSKKRFEKVQISNCLNLSFLWFWKCSYHSSLILRDNI